jgi:tetratricopeptide (TPR) repeat protein
MASQDGSMGVQAAYDALARFGAEYGELPLRLLLHVAVPQRFRADFVNLAKLNFLPEARGDLSLDADVLFAPVVESLGAGYFRLDGELRRQCVMLLDAAYRGQRELRSGRVADLLLSYLNQLSRNAAIGLDPMLEEYVTIERWVAFAFLSPSVAACRFADALDHATKGEALEPDPVRIRFGGIAAALALPLSGQPELLDYARGYDALVSSHAEEARSIFERLDTGEIKVGNVILRPEALLTAVASKRVVDAPDASSQTAAPSPTDDDGIPIRSRLAQLAVQICHVANEDGPVGRGLLIGSDLVLTTTQVTRRAASEKSVKCLFFDMSQRPRTALGYVYVEHQAGFALIRLVQPIDGGPLELSKQSPAAATGRPWMPLSETATPLAAGSELRIFILDGVGLNTNLRAVVSKPSADQTRLYYTVNDANKLWALSWDLSGSPIFDEHWRLVGLHGVSSASGEYEGIAIDSAVSTAAGEVADLDLFLFVSHVAEDRPAALEIVDELERRGIPCWIAPRDVRPGRPFDDEIVEAIDASRAMLLIFSDRCNEHEYIRREITVAGESRKVIIPFRIEDAQPRRALRARLSDLHWIDGFVSRERAIDQVIRAVNPDQTWQREGQRREQENAFDPRFREKITSENTLAARQALEKSLALDRDSAEVWSNLAIQLMIDFVRNRNNATREVIAQAEEAVRKAYAIDRSLALAHAADGWVRGAKGDHQGALDAFDEALRLDPNLAMAFVQKANQLIYLGRAQEASALVTQAIHLSPLDPDLGSFYWVTGRAYFMMKDYDNAIHWLEKSVQEMPTAWETRAYLIGAYALTERLGEHEAQAALHEYRAKFQNWPLDPNIRQHYFQETNRDANPSFNAMLQELLRGLQIAKATVGFP